MVDEQKKAWGLGSDLPLSDPAEDQFGYDGFAALLAKAIVSNQHPQGLVLAVHGKWGSGKSSLMNFIKHHLTAMPQYSRPVLIDFNPWWFEGREDTATQLLNQFSAQLSDRRSDLRKLAKLIAKYSKVIADTTAELTGFGWLSKPLGWLLKIFPNIKWLQEPKGIPAIKRQLAAALKSSGKRFVFFIDDIDRLTPNETRDLFRAIKALADFPEVVYVLFFDKEEVAKSLSSSLQMDGEAYLEKIVQAQFHLPAVDPVRLRMMLFKGLDALIEAHHQPFAFEQARWNEVFHDGLESFIKKPRDVVRILNSLSVVYPPLAGEVNPVDFVALEFLRVFQPSVYGAIRADHGLFCGAAPEGSDAQLQYKSRLEQWRQSIPAQSRAHVVALVEHLFPKVSQLQRAGGFLISEQARWRLSLRVCSSECYPVYFQFGLPEAHVSQADLEGITRAETVEVMCSLLLDAKNVLHPDGHSKARDMLDRLLDFRSLPPQQAEMLIEAVTATAHRLLEPKDEVGGPKITLNLWRFQWLITGLLESQPLARRQEFLRQLVETSPGLWMVVHLANLAVEKHLDSERAFPVFEGMELAFVESLAKTAVSRLHTATLAQFMEMPHRSLVVSFWQQWGDVARLRDVFRPVTDSENELLSFLEKFVLPGRLGIGRSGVAFFDFVFEPVNAAIDIQAAMPHLPALLSRDDLSPRLKAALAPFVESVQIGEQMRAAVAEEVTAAPG